MISSSAAPFFIEFSNIILHELVPSLGPSSTSLKQHRAKAILDMVIRKYKREKKMGRE